jgi:hypothetical protein
MGDAEELVYVSKRVGEAAAETVDGKNAEDDDSPRREKDRRAEKATMHILLTTDFSKVDGVHYTDGASFYVSITKLYLFDLMALGDGRGRLLFKAASLNRGGTRYQSKTGSGDVYVEPSDKIITQILLNIMRHGFRSPYKTGEIHKLRQMLQSYQLMNE